MNANYGGTLGKLIVGIKIKTVNGEIINYKEAFLRNIVDLGFGLTLGIMQVYTLINISDPTYSDLSCLTRPDIYEKTCPKRTNH